MMRRLLLTALALAVFAAPLAPAFAQAEDGPGEMSEIPADRDDPRFDAVDLLNPMQPGVGFCLLGFFCDLDPTNVPAVSFAYKLAAFIFSFLGFVMVLILIYGGFRMLTSFGNPDGMKQGKDAVVAAIIGFILLTLAYVAVRTLITITR